MRKLRIFTVIVFLLAVVGYGVYSFNERVIKDNDAPVISSEADIVEYSVNGDEAALMEGLTAYDRHDGDITDRIMVESISQLVNKNIAKITYVVFDSSNNVGRYTRSIRYTDYELPKFSLNGPLIFAKGADISIFDKLSAYDVVDGDISDSIRVTSQNVDNLIDGEYTITVQVTNSMGDTSAIPLTVTINSESVRKQLIELNEYLVYIEKDSSFNPWNYVKRVTTSNGSVKGITVAEMDSNVDTSEEGVYEVRYSYSNYTAILTVVVQ
ncbi:MAG: hypothetical protein E7456_06255 [Ruminococcaceae bacterium]|nr:hypothetical protein [Oscillospiraceae bacterium]